MPWRSQWELLGILRRLARLLKSRRVPPKGGCDGANVYFSESTDRAFLRLAEFTGIEGENLVGRLIQDAVRTYEWVLSQQAYRKVIAALEPQDVVVLEESAQIQGERETLAPLVDERRIPEMQGYFALAYKEPSLAG